MSARRRVWHAECPCPAHTLGDLPRGDPWHDHPVASSSPVGAQRASVSVKTRRGGGQDAGNSVQDTAAPVESRVLSDSGGPSAQRMVQLSFVAVHYATSLFTQWRMSCIA